MTDRFALTYAETLRRVVARIKPESVEAVKAAADILDVVGARTQLRKAGARYTGRCPFHEERTPSFSVNAVDKLYYCFGCGAGGDLISFVKETENTRLLRRDRMARRPLPGRARVRGDLARRRPRARTPRAARQAARAGRVLLRAQPVGDGRRRGGARTYLAGPRARRGDLPRVPPRLRPGRADAGAEGAGERSSRGRNCSPPASSTAAATITSRSASSSRSPTPAGACSASRPASSARTIRCRPST